MFLTKQEFDHGKTRDLGIRHSQADVVICMTQDAMPCDEYLVEELLKGLEKPGVVQAYARQLPAKDCGVIEALSQRVQLSGNKPGKNKTGSARAWYQDIFCFQCISSL